jgi:predicted dehydrogenase
MRDNMKVLLVGCGSIADVFHLPAWDKVDGAAVCAICDINEGHATEIAEKYGIRKVYVDYNEALDCEKPDIVDICTPHGMHYGQTMLALNAGSHVIVEKPMSVSAKHIDDIMAMSREQHLKVMCAQHQRFRDVTRYASELILSGKLGEIYYTRARAIKCCGVPGRKNSYTEMSTSYGGPLMDLGVHIIDIAWLLMGKPIPKKVDGKVFRKLGPEMAGIAGDYDKYDVEDLACGSVQFENGAFMTVETSYILNGCQDVFEVELMGTKGGLVWPKLLYTSLGKGGPNRCELPYTDESLASVNELKHFVECIVNDSDTIVPLNDSKEVISIIEDMYKSAIDEKTVDRGNYEI